MIDENDNDTESLPLDMPKETVRDTVKRDPVTGKFLPGTRAGPGRPKGRLDQLNVQVVSTLESIWASRGEEVIEHLASEKPEVLAGLVAKLIPQSLAAEAIEGEAQKGQGNQEVTIKVVTQQHQDVLPPREVVGELMDDSDDTHHDGAHTIN
jgi:hypothetical protein